jgi:hypothetical protein
MSITVGEIFDEATIAALKTYLGSDEKTDLTPSQSATYDVRAIDTNRGIAGLAEVAFRIRYGNLCMVSYKHDNVVAGWTDQEIFNISDLAMRTQPPFPGSVVGISFSMENAITAGLLTCKAGIAGTPTALNCTGSTSDPNSNQATQLPGIETFTALQGLSVFITTDGSFAAGATPSISAHIWFSLRDA